MKWLNTIIASLNHAENNIITFIQLQTYSILWITIMRANWATN